MSQDGTPPRSEIQTTAQPAPSPFMRQAKQFGLLFAGAGFLAASVAVSRRSVLRMRRLSYPHFYWSNKTPAHLVDNSDRGLVAIKALSLATLNVTAFGIMLVGGIGWGFDLSSIEELRQRTRRSLMKPGTFTREDEKKVEAEMEKILDAVYEKMGMEKPAKMDWDELDRWEQEAKNKKDDSER